MSLLLEAKTKTENIEGSGPESHSWQELDLNPAFSSAKEGTLARVEEATGMRKILAVG